MAIKGIKSIQTYMDHELFSRDTHAPDYVQELQNLVQAQMHTWEGKNFVDWCYSKNLPVTDEGLHPLLPAHQAAADFWKEKYDQAFA